MSVMQVRFTKHKNGYDSVFYGTQNCDAGFTEHKNVCDCTVFYGKQNWCRVYGTQKMFVIHCFTEHKNVCHEIGYRVLRNTKLLVKQGLRNTIIIIMYIHHQPSESSHNT